MNSPETASPIFTTAATARAASLASGLVQTCAYSTDNWEFLFQRADLSRRWTDGTIFAGDASGRRWIVRMLPRAPRNLAPVDAEP